MSDDGHELAKWKRHIDWWHMLPPGRPSTAVLNLLRPYVAGRQAVLILGSTPELRDLCIELGVPKVTIIDYSAEFHAHVTTQMIYSTPHEELILGKWQDVIPYFAQAFDAILADLVTGNIPYSDRGSLYASIARALKPNGVFCDRVLTNRSGYQSVDDLDERYLREAHNLDTVNRYANEYFFASEIVQRDQVVCAQNIRAELTGRYQSTPRLLRYLIRSADLVPNTGVWFYGQDWESLEAEYRHYLNITAGHQFSLTDPFESRIELLVSTAQS